MEGGEQDMIQGSKYITYNQKGGRSGHALKDIFTCYTLASVVDGLVVLPQEKWNETTIRKSGSLDGQVIINFDTDESQSMIDKGNFSKIITIKAANKQWNGMNFEYFSKLKKQIENAPQGSLVVLTGVIRLHLVQLTNWYNKKLIKRDSFADVIPVLRNLYFKDHDPKTIDCLSIHVRRGDIFNPNSPSYTTHPAMRWPVGHFEQAIVSFRKLHPHVPINIFSENMFSDDLKILERHDNLRLVLGDAFSLQKDINYMINSRFFMPCSSSLSTWISYISRGKIIITKDREIKYFHKEHIW